MLLETIKAMGFDNAAEVAVSDIAFEPSLIDLCKMNHCGNYGKCYSCPPHVGETNNLIEQAKGYQKAIVFQKIYQLEDSFDFEGMESSHKDFNTLTQTVNEFCRNNLQSFQVFGAGGCKICKECGAVSGIPCRFPEKAIPSLESYSIQVSKLAELAGIRYINGQNTVTYFGAVFL